MPIRLTHQLPIPAATLERRYGLMAETLRFETNDPALLAAADAAFGRFAVPADGRAPLVLSLFSEPAPAGGDDDAPTIGRVINRTRGDRYLVSGGSRDVGVAEVDAGVALGFVSAATARDTAVVRYSFVEGLALALLPRGRGYLVLHAAGVVRGDIGIAIQGPAGAGKSTLAMACARRGFGVFAEDAIFVRPRATTLELWGMPWVQRLLPDAAAFFPELGDVPPRRQPNGESKLEVDLDRVQPGRAVPCAPAGPILLLARGTGGPTRTERVDPAAAESQLEIHWPWDGGWSEWHEHGAGLLAGRDVHRLHMNGTPDDAVDAIERLMDARAGTLARP
jgi:hypothetical protein